MHQNQYKAKSIRAFIGAKNYLSSILFYKALGFQAVSLGEKMTLFRVNENLSFYLQDAYVKDWVDNSMIFLEVDDLDACWQKILQLNLSSQFEKVKLSGIKQLDWGREFFLHDPSGVLWHFGQFH